MRCLVFIFAFISLALSGAWGYTLDSTHTTYTASASGTNPNDGNAALSAEAFFTYNGGTLTILLTNTSSAATRVDSSVLTAMFFTLGPGQTLSLTGATASMAGSSVLNGTAPGDNNVGGEWAYLSSLGGTTQQGISSAGLGIFGDYNLNGPNLWKNDALDGGQGGIVSPTSTSAVMNGGLESQAVIKDHVLFTFLNVGPSIDILSVGFQFGTTLTDPFLVCTDCDLEEPPPVPEPSFYGLLTAGLGGLFLFARRRRQA